MERRNFIKRIHNTKEANLVIRNSTSFYSSPIDKRKPKGLWYGINNSWMEWCKSEMPDWIRHYNYELKIDLSKIIIISSKKQLIQFDKQYRIAEHYGINWNGIDWKAVVNNYMGIEINPYLWKCRFSFDVHWYYGWDCASGCIWNKKAILAIKKVEM